MNIISAMQTITSPKIIINDPPPMAMVTIITAAKISNVNISIINRIILLPPFIKEDVFIAIIQL